jgi:two-component system, chemotaxis family, protein-glutamate methylesterase/glutaminase
VTEGGGRSPPIAVDDAGPYRVMVCDDSAVIRGLITRNLESDPEIRVVTTVANGQLAINALARFSVEVLILDIEMPIMDGLTALPELIRAQPDLQIVMASTLTRRNAEISLRALAAGAADYLAKPSTTMALNAAADFQLELAGKVKALGAARRRAAGLRSPGRRTLEPLHASGGEASAWSSRPGLRPIAAPGGKGPILLRPALAEAPGIVAIGASTGGPQALFSMLGALRPGIAQPIVITQHMPATFTTILAEHIERASGIPTVEGSDGLPLEGGHAYVAPGDYHMVIEAQGTQRVLRLLKTPPENYCRPSVDPMLRSLSRVYGRKVLGVILTGMGQDGLRGGESVVAAGGALIAQDEATSVVWGMPGAVASAGLCSAVVPLNEVAPYIRRAAARAGP